jgi:hypothetical protein
VRLLFSRIEVLPNMDENNEESTHTRENDNCNQFYTLSYGSTTGRFPRAPTPNPRRYDRFGQQKNTHINVLAHSSTMQAKKTAIALLSYVPTGNPIQPPRAQFPDRANHPVQSLQIPRHQRQVYTRLRPERAVPYGRESAKVLQSLFHT